ncbi:hypothetical protein [Brevundimonas aurantiaca]|jgi:hypothetical protein|uniref:hypothetical protein n=1 Tax=Brevundimonas aurantiaca TaxID=74316 RepID=UPI001D184411|nr:hypothetical protein [Brevundimonas aurantiaca]MCC4295134.1 hypothetical protein [Brevundimonas aurantiaca]
MQRTTDRLFTPAERRLALIAAVVVVAFTVLTLFTGGLVAPSAGGQMSRGVSDLPGVTDARPLS